MKYIVLLLLSFLWSMAASACPPCPALASYSGSGAATNVSGCRCTNASHVWNGSACVVSCPAGTSTTGAGGTANPSTCRCNTAGQSWNGSSCVTCPSGSSTSGTGATTNVTGCRCTNTSHVWNGSSCAAPPPTNCAATSKTWTVGGVTCTGNLPSTANGSSGTATDSTGTETGSATYSCSNGTWAASPSSATCGSTCMEGAIRAGSPSAQVCTGGVWVSRPVATYCTAPSEVKIKDDEWMRFHQSAFMPQGSDCVYAQRSNSNKSDIDLPGRVRGDDSSLTCKNNSNCTTLDSGYNYGGSCPAATLSWSVGANVCYASVVASANYGSQSPMDNTGPLFGAAAAQCLNGIWNITPNYCSTTPSNCYTTPPSPPYVPSLSFCSADGSMMTSGTCCTPGATNCYSNSSLCP